MTRSDNGRASRGVSAGSRRIAQLGSAARRSLAARWEQPGDSLKRFNCDSIMPGCDHVFTGAGDQSVLDQVLIHAAAEHGLIAPPLPFIELVMTHTHPFALVRQPGGAVGKCPSHPEHSVPTNNRTVRTSRPVSIPAGPIPARGSNVLPFHRRERLGSERAHETYRHECLLYSGKEGFLDAVVPFVRDGLTRQEPVMIAVAEPRLSALRLALGRTAEQAFFVDMSDLGHNPARLVPAWLEFTEQFSGAGRPVRGVAEPIWATRQPAEIVEAQLQEALLNVSVPPDVPLWLLCPYDTAELDEQILTEAHRSHPVVVEMDAYRGSTQYGGVDHLEEFFTRPLPEPAVLGTPISFDPRGHDHIGRVLDLASNSGIPVDRAVRLATAIDEMACVAHRETGNTHLRAWLESGALICEMVDPGRACDPIGRGAVRGGLPPRDRALRLANELSDLVQVRSGVDGTTTRIWCWL